MSGQITVLEQRQWTLGSSSLTAEGDVLKSPVFKLFGTPYYLTLIKPTNDRVRVTLEPLQPQADSERAASNEYVAMILNLDVQGRVGSSGANQESAQLTQWSSVQSLTYSLGDNGLNWHHEFDATFGGHITVEITAEMRVGKEPSIDPAPKATSSKVKRARRASGASNDHELFDPDLADQSTQTDLEPVAKYAVSEEAIKVLECQVCHSRMDPLIRQCATEHSHGTSNDHELFAPDLADQSTQTDHEPSTKYAISEEAITVLECQVCHLRMKSPIRQCATGHSICSKCRDEIDECPSCGRHFLDYTRNFTLESLLDLLTLPCDETDCPASYTQHQRETHLREECLHREMECSVCGWCGQLISFRDHVETNHDDYVTRMDYNSFAEDKTSLKNADADKYVETLTFVVANDGALFCLTVKESEGGFYLCILHFGTSTSAMNYRFVVELSSSDKNIDFHSRLTSNVHCDLDCEDRECIALGTEKQLRRQGLITANGEIKLQFCIMKNGPA